MQLENVKLFDGTSDRLQDARQIIIQKGIISKIEALSDQHNEKNDYYINCSGLTAVPGLINLHVHLCLDASQDPLGLLRSESESMTFLTMISSAQKTLEGGITTVRDLGTRGTLIFELRQAIENGRVLGPRIVASGQVITRTGGHGSGWIGRECNGKAVIREGIRSQLKQGADVIKVMATGGVMTLGTSPYLASYSLEELETVVDEARRENVQVAAHAEGREGIEWAVRAGIDTIEHGTFIDQNIIDVMLEKNSVWVPTISPHRFGERARESLGIVSSELPSPLRSVRDKARIGGGRNISAGALAHFEKYCMTKDLKIGVGTDAGTPFVPHEDLVLEMEMFMEYGFSNYQVLKMATFGNAQILKLDDHIGSIEEGKLADIVLIQGNPLDDLQTLRHIAYVIKDGRIVFSNPAYIPGGIDCE